MGITYYFTKHYNRGRVRVTIDGEAPFSNTLIDLYAPTLPGGGVFQQSVRYPLSYGTHTIQLAVDGTNNGRAPVEVGYPSDNYIDLDKFVVD